VVVGASGSAHSIDSADRATARAIEHLVKRVPVLALALSGLTRSDPISTQNVLSVSHRLQVSRVDAAAIPAEMVEFQSSGDGTQHGLVDDPVSPLHSSRTIYLAASSDASVPSTGTREHPASVVVDGRPAKDAIDGWHGGLADPASHGLPQPQLAPCRAARAACRCPAVRRSPRLRRPAPCTDLQRGDVGQHADARLHGLHVRDVHGHRRGASHRQAPEADRRQAASPRS
jgi:hypothetical protein